MAQEVQVECSSRGHGQLWFECVVSIWRRLSVSQYLHIVVARKLWDAVLSLSFSISLPSSPPQAKFLQPFQNEVSTVVCLHDPLSPALVAKQLECRLACEFNLPWKRLWVLTFNQVSVSRMWGGSHGSLSPQQGSELGYGQRFGQSSQIKRQDNLGIFSCILSSE